MHPNSKNLESDLKKFTEKYENGGIELTHNLVDSDGVIAAMAYNKDNKMFAFKLLGPKEAMAQDRTHFFNVKEYVYDKKEKRLSLSSQGDNLYILRPCVTDVGAFITNTYALSKEDKDYLKAALQASVES